MCPNTCYLCLRSIHSREGNVGLPQVEDPCSTAEERESWRSDTDTLPRIADHPSREGYVGLPQGEAGSSRETDGRLMRENYQSSSTANESHLIHRERSTPALTCHGFPNGEGYVGLPQGEAGSSRETDGRLKRVIYEPSFPSALLPGSSTTTSGTHLPLIPSHRARRVSRAPLRGDLAFNTNNGDLALGVASGRGKAWDMELGEGYVGLPRGEAGSCRETDGRLMRENYQSSSTAESTRLFEAGIFDGPLLPWLDTGSPEGGQRETEQTMVVPYNVHLKDPSQAQDDNPHRVRYFCGDADPNLVAERVLRLCRQLRGWRVPTPLLRNKLGYCQAFEFGRRRGRCEVS